MLLLPKKCADGVGQCHKKVIAEVIVYLLFYQFVVHRDAHGAYRIYQVKKAQAWVLNILAL